MTNKEVYRIKYEFDYDLNKGKGYTVNQVKEIQKTSNEAYGFCDGFVFISILEPSDGTFSIEAMTNNGKDDFYHPRELFKIWSMLGASILDSESLLIDWQKKILEDSLNSVRGIIVNKKDGW
jgi:hypothetical protein